MATTSNPSPEAPQKSPSKLPLIIGAVVAVVIVAWLLMRKPPESTPTGPDTPLGGTRPTPIITPNKVASNLLPKKLTLFVPNDDAKLERVQIVNTVQTSDGDPFNDYVRMADVAVKALEKRAPELFPAGSYLAPVTREGDLVSINFASKWYQMPLWTQGSANATLAQESIVNSLAMIEPIRSRTINVQFLQDGKIATTLGEIDLKDPLTANIPPVAKG